MAQSRISFRPQNLDDETVVADDTDYVWDPDWSHPSFIIITTILFHAITTIFSKKDYDRTIPPTIDATPLIYDKMFTDRTGNKSLSSTFINTPKKLN